MPTQTAQQIIATARRNAAALPSEQAAARERRTRHAKPLAKPAKQPNQCAPPENSHRSTVHTG